MRRALAATVVALVAACAPLAPAPTPAAAAVAELAPSGKLRAAINFGNPILATRDAASGEARGVSVDLARELARRLDLPVELVLYTSAGQVFDGATKNAWDIAFLAIDPVRERELAFTAPYVIIEGAYLVPIASPIRANAEVDRDGVKVVVGNGSAYDLYLSRELKRATLVRAPTSPLVVDTMLAQRADVAAGVKQQLEADAKRVAGVRLLDGRFMVIEQAMATPRQRAAAARYLGEFVEAMKADGFVARALARHHVSGVTIAPPASR
jgi:polar amino acid transport system substrate-binding protein